jgi:hypothetical protein
MQGMDEDPSAAGPEQQQQRFKGLNNWFRGAGDQAAGDGAPTEILYGGKRVTQWPYDDYHTVQQQFYVKLDELDQAKAASGGESKEDRISTASSSSTTTPQSTLQRPPDPPDIPTAVRNLALNDFEHKAEERAISIVGTWLFDCGLIDELLVHGGMTSVAVQEENGIEIGTAGFPIEGPSKMDREMAKLKATSQRTLGMINSRLNDGVAASGAEVQELVNTVNTTKDDLGRLRELSTYISNISHDDLQHSSSLAGGERRQKFMLTRYPKLKKAINARRNLARCFRELDFYSQIPVTCDRLRDDLHSAEWTENEWNSLRDVSREHVELEVFLVEAEAGMKKRIDEEAMEMRGQSGNEPRSRNDPPKSRSSYIPSSKMPHNYEEVDNFLHEHVKNVWELGDEIRLRIRSGIGAAFDLAMNNPAAMVALVEAVEVYETAAEEYKTVHGEEAGRSSNSLRFTDMRASALKQIYQDFELRGLEVFREVHESVSLHVRVWLEFCPLWIDLLPCLLVPPPFSPYR